MSKHAEFITVFLLEANFAGVPLVAFDVIDKGTGIYVLKATFKDGGTATVHHLTGIFAGDGFLARKELLASLVLGKVPAPVKLAPVAVEVAPVEEEEDGADTPDLEVALRMLDPEDDAHWTLKGLPDLNVLKEYMGSAVTRKEVNETGVVRE